MIQEKRLEHLDGLNNIKVICNVYVIISRCTFTTVELFLLLLKPQRLHVHQQVVPQPKMIIAYPVRPPGFL